MLLKVATLLTLVVCIFGQSERYSHAAKAIAKLIDSARTDLNKKTNPAGEFTLGSNTGKDLPLIAGFVRLAFHDCVGVGGCDGCINHNLVANRGLKKSTDALDDLYKNYANAMSRADFYVLAAYTALDVAPIRRGLGRFDGDQTSVTRKFGRTVCGNGESSDEDDTAEEFPTSCFNLDKSAKYFKDTFGLNTDETIALMGAHTLGMIRPKKSDTASGKKAISGEWVQGGGCSSRLNVKFFENYLTNAKPKNECRWRGSGGTFLDSDISMSYKFTRDADGVNCIIGEGCGDKCCEKTEKYDLTKSYENDNEKWLADFSKAFTKMVEYDQEEVYELTDISYERPDILFTNPSGKGKKGRMGGKGNSKRRGGKPRVPRSSTSDDIIAKDELKREVKRDLREIVNEIEKLKNMAKKNSL